MLYRGHGPVKFGMLVASLVGLSFPTGAVSAQGAPALLDLGVLAVGSSGTSLLTGVSQSTDRIAPPAKKSSTSSATKAKSALKTTASGAKSTKAASSKAVTSANTTKASKASKTVKASKASKTSKTLKAPKASKTSKAPKASKTNTTTRSMTPPPPQESGASTSLVTPPDASVVREQGSEARSSGSTAAPAAVAASQGPAPFHILYNEKPSDGFTVPDVGAQMYFGVYQATDPNAHSGQIDVPRVLAATRLIVAANPNMEWGMLDFEHPYNEVLLAGPSDPLYANAIASKVALIKAVKAEFPNIKWTYYGVPRLPYWVDGQTWSTFSDAKRRELFDHAQLSYGPILRELDWVQPSVYDKYERNLGFPLTNLTARDAAERAFRVALIEVIRDWYSRNELPAKPILPAVCAWYQGHTKATMFRAIPSSELESDQLRPIIEAGADGVSSWSTMGHKTMLATINFTPNTAWSQQAQGLARHAFAVDILGSSSVTQVNWQDPAVKTAIEHANNQTLAALLELIRKLNVHHREALANAGGGEP